MMTCVYEHEAFCVLDIYNVKQVCEFQIKSDILKLNLCVAKESDLVEVCDDCFEIVCVCGEVDEE